MPRRNIPERSPFLTAGLFVLLIWNGYQAAWWSFSSLILLSMAPALRDSPALQETLREKGITFEELRTTVSQVQLFAAAYGCARAAASACLGLLFLWKRWAFWCFAVCSALIFGINLWAGSPVWEASIDLVGLAVLIALLLKSEPKAWPQLR